MWSAPHYDPDRVLGYSLQMDAKMRGSICDAAFQTALTDGDKYAIKS